MAGIVILAILSAALAGAYVAVLVMLVLALPDDSRRADQGDLDRKARLP